MDKQQRKREEMAYNAGAGVWFNKHTREQVQVEVFFYPKTSLWLTDARGRRKVTKAELEMDYERLKL